MSIDRVGNQCCGCRACLQSCGVGAIKIVTDAYGFEYPKIDFSCCIHCGKCESVCPAINTIPKTSNPTMCGMAYALDSQIKFRGSSGGIFGVLANSVLREHGVVFGAAFDQNLKLKTQKAETAEELIPLYKSKYLLCDTSCQFQEIEKELKKGRPVLYCSSPCQIAALKLFLKKDYENLLLIDFVCHGVGSQTLFDRSVAYIEAKYKVVVGAVTMRFKKSDASSHYYELECQKNGRPYKKSDLYFSFPYYNAYCKQLACRDSCYDCIFATRERVGDITVGDFHTIEKYDPKVDRFAGVSMLLVNSEKGCKWFEKIKESIYWKPMESEMIYSNNRFSRNVAIPLEQQAFRESIAQQPFELTVKRFLRPLRDWKRLIYYKSPRFLRNLFKKMI